MKQAQDTQLRDVEQSFVRPHPATTFKGESFPILIPFFYTHTQLAQYYPFCQSRKPLIVLFFFMSHQALWEKAMCRLVMSQYTKNFWEYLNSINFVFDFGLVLGYLQLTLDNQGLEANNPRTVERESVSHKVQRDRLIGFFFGRRGRIIVRLLS